MIALTGPLNLTARNPQRYSDFAKTLGEVMYTPLSFPVPESYVRGMFGDLADIMVHGK